jgi:hypothetical protein
MPIPAGNVAVHGIYVPVHEALLLSFLQQCRRHLYFESISRVKPDDCHFKSSAMNDLHKRYHHGSLKAAVLARAAKIIATEGLAAMPLRSAARDLGMSSGAPHRQCGTGPSCLPR